ncbi:hypothetical protein, partial [Staphylococcus aureus]
GIRDVAPNRAHEEEQQKQKAHRGHKKEKTVEQQTLHITKNKENSRGRYNRDDEDTKEKYAYNTHE